MLVDSHCHLNLLDLTPYENGLQEVIDNAEVAGVSQFLCVSVDLTSLADIMSIVRQYVNVYASVGIHPSTQLAEACSIDDLLKRAADDSVIAIGETGLDYHYNEGDLTWQRERFATHIAAAKQIKKPLIIHTRDARDDTIAIMKSEAASDIGGVMHCFTETWEMAKAALDLNFYISFSGIVTFKSAENLREVAKKMPLDRILVETDSPYLAPVPYRGKANVPAYVREVAEFMADLRGMSFGDFAKLTTDNFHRCFNL